MGKAKKVRVVELFAGVGGFRLGFERCAKKLAAEDSTVTEKTFDTVWANQWEPGQAGQWAYKCYEAHFGPGSCSNKDIATVIDEVPDHDLLVGGFPCQDYSVAATGARGIEGKKGVLWWSINDIIKKKHPNYILLENVDRLLKSPASQRGRDFGIILKCLDDEDYAVEWRVINAADYGEVQRRRRTFIFACRKTTKHYKIMCSHLPACGGSGWIHDEGFFSRVFPVANTRYCTSDFRTGDLSRFKDLVEVTHGFKLGFCNSGLIMNGKIYTEEVIPDGNKVKIHKTLSDVVSREAVDRHYFISEKDMEAWKFMKGAKKIPRVSKSTGFEYTFSEGPIAFPDPLDRPARTMLTSEGTKNRSSHVISDPFTGKLRRLTPEECEKINGFDVGWTDTGMPERQRYFIMGNALVVPLIEKMGEALLEIM